MQFQAEVERMKVDNLSESLDNLLEDSQDNNDDDEEGDASDDEREREQGFVTSRPALLVNQPGAAQVQVVNTKQSSSAKMETIEFKSIESDLKNMSASAKGPLDDLENIDDLNVLNEISKNMDNYGRSCIMINDTLNETTSSAEVLREISDKMTNQLLDFFGSESTPAISTSQSVPSSHRKASEDISNFSDNYQQPQVRGQKRLLPSWMKVGDVDAKHFKVDLGEEEKEKKEKMSADAFTAAVAKMNFEFNASCDLCDFRDPNRKSVMKHRNAEHNGAPFQCKQCGKTFKQCQGLVNHRNNYHMEMLVKQPRYNHLFSLNQNLNKIMCRTPCRMQCGQDYLDEHLLRSHEERCYTIMLARDIADE